MQYLMQKLPIEIVNYIIPYTYNVQQKTLLNDIENFTEVKTFLSNLYHKYWIIERLSLDQEDKNWLINDLFRCANNYNPTKYYVDSFYNIFKRNIYLQTNEEVDKYVNELETKDVTTQINVLLGLLTEQERSTFRSTFQQQSI
jgi:hypothetical protein